MVKNLKLTQKQKHFLKRNGSMAFELKRILKEGALSGNILEVEDTSKTSLVLDIDDVTVAIITSLAIRTGTTFSKYARLLIDLEINK